MELRTPEPSTDLAEPCHNLHARARARTEPTHPDLAPTPPRPSAEASDHEVAPEPPALELSPMHSPNPNPTDTQPEPEPEVEPEVEPEPVPKCPGYLMHHAMVVVGEWRGRVGAG